MDSTSASEIFDYFVAATTFKSIVQLFNRMCAILQLDPLLDSANFYQQLKPRVKSWKAEKLWLLLDKRANQKEYKKQKVCQSMRVLVVGAGPCGLRAAIECALLGAKVVVVEKRDRFSRNNVLHIWPFVIHDLKNLGAKVFYPKFCAGSIDHISIRQLQCILLKVALILGVEIHEGVGFESLQSPTVSEDGQVCGWRANFLPENHYLSEFEFDALIGADGQRNTIPGFPRRELRGKLAIGITANFVNKRSKREEQVSEISGVAFIFNQQFFKDMKETTGIDLENIVYYKDETHYFVMCAKKQSLLDKGVLREDDDDISSLLSPRNIDQSCLLNYAREAADFATDGALPHLEYALNHFGQPDVAMFDFTSLFSAQCSIRLVERNDQRLIMSIVGDSLHEPFWPTGSGCARGFLGVFDAVWTLRSFALAKQGPMEILAERESIYRLLAQTTPENLHKNHQKYTIDPRTRYVSLEMTLKPTQVCDLVDTDNYRMVEISQPLPTPKKNAHLQDAEYLRRQRIIVFCQMAINPFKLRVDNLTSSWVDGLLICALLSRFMPDFVDYSKLMTDADPDSVIKDAILAVKAEYGIELEGEGEYWPPDRDDLASFLEKLIERWTQDAQFLHMDLAVVSSTEKKLVPKRKAPTSFDISKVKKSDSIKKRSQALIDSLSGNLPSEQDFDLDDFLAGGGHAQLEAENFNQEQVESILHEWDEDQGTSNGAFGERRFSGSQIKALQEKISGPYVGTDNAAKYTKRPLVDKLHPERLYKVEQIVNGSIEKSKVEDLYSRKRRQAQIVTRKMEEKDLAEMESKLEQTAMGKLIDKDQFKVLTSKEEKKYKDFDEVLKKANALAKSRDLSGVKTVSEVKRRQGPPPVPPPKSVQSPIVPSSSFVPSPGSCNTPISHGPALRLQQPRPASVCQDMMLESPFGQKKQFCAVCAQIVYLAERMQVEGMNLHKKCFRCAYCNQSLRLNNCGFLRDMPHCEGRFYCAKHLQLPLSERVRKIDRESGSTKDSPMIESNLTDQFSTSKVSPPRNLGPFKPTTSVKLQHLNSPTTLLAKTTEKMRLLAQDSMKSQPQENLTPERAEFECFRGTVEPGGQEDEMEEAAIERHNLGYSLREPAEGDLDLEPEMDPGATSSIGGPDQAESSTTDSDLGDSSEDEGDLSERELDELEKTVLENNSAEKTISYEQAASLATQWKRRRTIDTNNDGKNQRARRRRTESSADEEVMSPAEVSGALQFSPTSIMESAAGLSNSAKIKLKRLPSSEKDQTVRQQKLRELAEFREKARLRALELAESEQISPVRRASEPADGQRVANVDWKIEGHSSQTVEETSARSNGESQSKGSPSGKGLFARLFSPERKKPQAQSPTTPESAVESIAGTGVSSESKKENSILGKLGMMRYKKCKSRSPTVDLATVRARAATVDDKLLNDVRIRPGPTSPNIAAKSPKKKLAPKADVEDYDSEDGDECDFDEQRANADHGSIEVSDRDIKKVQRAAERLVRQQEQNRQRKAQDIQRRLQENEVRRSEVAQNGAQLEKRLADDPENRWVLDQWLIFVEEREQLDRTEIDLKLRAREVELENRHGQLQAKLKQLISQDTSQKLQAEHQLLQETLSVVEERNKVVNEMEEHRQRDQRADQYMRDILEKKGYSYRHFGPVFLTDLNSLV